MRKLELFELLLKCGLCLPGNLNFSKKWYMSVWTVISILGIILTIGNGLLAIINCPSVPKPPSTKNDYTTNPTEISSNINSVISTSTDNSNTKSKPFDPSTRFCISEVNFPNPTHAVNESDNKTIHGEAPGVIVEIAVSSYQLLLFATNVSLRVLLLLTFPMLRNALKGVVTSSDTQRISWIQASQLWATHEKIFCGLMVASLIEREIEPLFDVTHILSSACSLDWASFALEMLRAQSQALFSLDFISDSITLVLMGFIATFVHLFDKQANGNYLVGDRNQLPEAKVSKPVQNIFVLSLRDHNGSTRERDGIKIAVSSGWSRKIISSDSYPGVDLVSTPQCQSKSHLQEEFSHRINFYFDTVCVWKRCEFASGFLALIIFLELTTTFCLNTFVGIAAASASGVFNPRTWGSFFRAIIIIGKMICLATLAQTLPDSVYEYLILIKMDIFARRVLKLSWACLESGTVLSLSRRVGNCISPLYDANQLEDSANDTVLKSQSMSQIVAYIESNPVALSALGYFTISKSTLTAVFGVIITYLVVLIQFHMQILQSEIK